MNEKSIHPIFGTLTYDDHWWIGKADMDFFGKKVQIAITLETEYDTESYAVTEKQCCIYQTFLEKWPDLQETVVKSIIAYYNEDERFSYGPEDEDEFLAWWPPLDTIEEMLQKITWTEIVIPCDSIIQCCDEGKRCLYLLFTHEWGNDLDCHGVGIKLLNEQIEEVGYQDIAF